jgi:hypothetical protein
MVKYQDVSKKLRDATQENGIGVNMNQLKVVYSATITN